MSLFSEQKTPSLPNVFECNNAVDYLVRVFFIKIDDLESFVGFLGEDVDDIYLFSALSSFVVHMLEQHDLLVPFFESLCNYICVVYAQSRPYLIAAYYHLFREWLKEFQLLEGDITLVMFRVSTVIAQASIAFTDGFEKFFTDTAKNLIRFVEKTLSSLGTDPTLPKSSAE